MSRSRSHLLLFAAAPLLLVSCASTVPQPTRPVAPPDTRAADESTIRSLDADWVKAVASKDADRSASFYADNAMLFVPGAPLSSGKEAVQKAVKEELVAPGTTLSFTPTKVTVARSSDLAYEIGDYSLTVTPKSGKPQTQKGKYIVVWGKQSDGSWKALVDAPTTTQ